MLPSIICVPASPSFLSVLCCPPLPPASHCRFHFPFFFQSRVELKETNRKQIPPPNLKSSSRSAQNLDLSTMFITRQIPLEDNHSRCLVQCKEQITDVFLRKFKCEMEFRGPESSGHQAASFQPEIVYRKGMSSGLTVSVWKDDLTRQDADIVVNAANENLIHAGGLALALVKAGGPIIEKESKDFIRSKGSLKTGELAVTSPGNLPCKRLLHAVGPVWYSDTAKQCESELAECIKNVLRYVNAQRDIKSVAIPAISSGIFHFPLQKCAEIIVNTIHLCFHYFKKEIRLVNKNDLAVQAMKSACESVFGPSDALGGATASNETQPVTHSMKSSAPPSSLPKNKAKRHRSSLEKSPSITIRGLTLHLKSGLIEEQKVLGAVTWDCLQSAHTHNSPSISFPALGTGNIGLSKQDVARIMTETVINFARKNQSTLEVNFVIFPQDRDSQQAFQEQMNLHRAHNMEAPMEQRDPSPDFHDKSPELLDVPCLIIKGPSNEDVEEATAWLEQILHFHSISIQNNLILLLGRAAHDILSSPDFPNVSMEEILSNGSSSVKIDGRPQDRVKAAIQVERLLLDVQKDHAVALEEELLGAAVMWFYENSGGTFRYSAKANRELEKVFVRQSDTVLESEPCHTIHIKSLRATGKDGEYQLHRRTICDNALNGQRRCRPEYWLPCITSVDPKTQEFQLNASKLKKEKLTLVKMEKIYNKYLEEIFQYKKETKPFRKTCNVYQLVPRQFTEYICDFGFQRIFCNPKDPKYGPGIYFTDSPRRALDCFQTPQDDNALLYIFQAEVLVDSPTSGYKDSPGLVFQKPNSQPEATDVLDLCDSVVNSSISASVYVIPDSFQANPLNLFTCRR
ncbi:protein mono-ADP-ribosyltransferase PARP9 isoform X3 [Pyxicephalus adspersus]|uniref:protein mono-ADP-ribosyltransferase PARP9 isoform X3 n=1 Tax=Pyxicephalus adspersus TaxID=30357 RepID=UPI003B5A020B